MSQNQDAAEVPSHLRGKMTPLPVKPRRNCNAIDEDGSTQYDDSNLAVFIQLSAPAAYHGQSDGRLSWPECRLLTIAKVTVLALTMSGVTALAWLVTTWVAGILPQGETSVCPAGRS
ncbi:hypothetical protein Pyn_04783 [Prunus yedoensis var. nudiflora]|uniref:Uncharacterized protein n=1 Tax=Prunus yedoensis var. nudiflora TaxID=2094558 RepID=A0A314Y9T1_PRUYE|nr:hypothetical protein Pyn_04783 [Prunus yedoensis var. nudiflora]